MAFLYPSLSPSLKSGISVIPTFTPTDLSGLGLWLDASDASTISDSSGVVTQWDDKSGNAKHSVSSSGTEPLTGLAELAGQNGLRFTETQLLTTPFVLADSGYTAVVVARLNAAISAGAAFPSFIKSNSDSQSVFLRKSTGNFEFKSLASGANDPRPGYNYENSFPTGVESITTTVAQLDSVQLYRDDHQVTTNARSATGTSLTVDSGLIIGTSFAGDIFEIIIYDRILNATELASVQDYAHTKWRDFFLTLDSSETSPALSASQGVGYDGTHYYTSSNNLIRKYSADWTQVAENTDPIGDTGLGGALNHLGAIHVMNDKIYGVLEEFPNSPYDTQHIVVFNTSDLSFDTSFDISAQAFEASGITYNNDDDFLYISSFLDSGTLRKYNLSGVYQGTLTLNYVPDNAQDVCWLKGYFYVTSDKTPYHAVYKYENDGTYIGRVYTFDTDDGFQECEGIHAYGDNLITLQINTAIANVYRLLLSASAIVTSGALVFSEVANSSLVHFL